LTNIDFVLISPIDFARTMRLHWEQLGNVWSPALEQVWIRMAGAFGCAVIDFDKGVNTWHVLQPPTGTGKTQGASVYCGMVAHQNMSGQRKLGILIVTRQITEANNLVSQINRLAGHQCAIAKHSQTKVGREQIRKSDILVITHAAYTKALEAKTRDEDDRWSSLIEWEHGQRRLTIIDESLSEIIAEYQVKAEDIRYALGFVSASMRKEHEWAITALEEMLSVVDKVGAVVDASPSGDIDSDNNLRGSRIVWRAVQESRAEYPVNMGIGELRVAMSGLPFDLMALKRASALDKERIRQRVDGTLASCEAVFSIWGYYARKGADHTLNVSRLLIPPNLPSPVVLDATASQNFLWELLGGRVNVHQIKEHPRSYGNVTLHVAYASGLGKTKMQEKAKERFPKLLTELQDRLNNGRKLLLCTHKGVKHIPLEYAPEFAAFDVAHWGAIDGRNDWQDFDTVVLFGLPYRDVIWANNAFMALQGLPENSWMSDPQWGAYQDVRREMQIKQMSVSLIQAINRIRCRRVIDQNGNCEPCDVFLVLPMNDEGQALLFNIQSDMPNVRVVDWEYEVDGPKTSKVRKGSSHEAILAYMSNAHAGELPLSIIRQDFDLKPDTFKALQASLREQSHPLTKALAEIGVTYHSVGKGRGAKSFLMKR
jgi:hypothetical protein